MKKTTLLIIAIAALVVLNIAVLAVVYFEPALKGPQGNRQPRDIIIDRLHFNERQIKEYQVLIDWHRDEIRRLDSNIRKDKQALYSFLKAYNKGVKDSLIADINRCQKRVEETHYKHFEDIRKLCTPQQQADFDELVDELPRLFGPRQPGIPPGEGHR